MEPGAAGEIPPGRTKVRKFWDLSGLGFLDRPPSNVIMSERSPRGLSGDAAGSKISGRGGPQNPEIGEKTISDPDALYVLFRGSSHPARGEKGRGGVRRNPFGRLHVPLL